MSPLRVTMLVLATLLPLQLRAQGAIADHAAIDRIFERFDRGGSPGCAVGVVRDGKLLYRNGYGFANLDHDIRITSSTAFYMASVSKQFTAAAIMLLEQDGKLSLDDDVRRHIPELPDYGERITLRHMVNHTSGLRDYLTLMPLAGIRSEDVFSEDDVLQLIVRQRELNFPPGSAYLYSNTGYYLLSEIVRRASGKSLREFTGERIFQPLGMTSTHFHDDRNMIVRGRATSYSPAGDGFRINYWANWDKVGSGGLSSTIDDMARWDANYYTGEVGGSALRERMLERGVLVDGDTISYAGGLQIGSYRGLRTVGHGGSTMSFRTTLLRFPDEKLTVLCLCNVSSAVPATLANQVADVVLAHRLAPRVAASPTRTGAASPPATGAAPAAAPARPAPGVAELAAYVGEYESSELANTWSVLLVDGSLVLRRRGASDATMRPTAPDRFMAGGNDLEFVRGPGGGVTAIVWRGSRVSMIRLDRRG